MSDGSTWSYRITWRPSTHRKALWDRIHGGMDGCWGSTERNRACSITFLIVSARESPAPASATKDKFPAA